MLFENLHGDGGSLMTAKAACDRADKALKNAGLIAASDSAVSADCLVGECVVCVFWVLVSFVCV
jgi:hypothetical protein